MSSANTSDVPTSNTTSSTNASGGVVDKAKDAVGKFMSKVGHHDTTVHEKVNTAVTHEQVTPTRHENVTTAVDKEVHQDHYHTTVQPVADRQVLPEKHKHNIVPTEHRSVEHGDAKDVEARLARESGQFRDNQVVGSTQHTQSVAPVVGGEHVHHHVHETIQPVVERSTIQPEVVHTTVPIHEVHHNAAKHHTTTAAPKVTMDEFQTQGGVLGGRETRTDAFEGEPATRGSATGTTGSGLTGHTSKKDLA